MKNYLLILGVVLTVFLVGKSFFRVDQPTQPVGSANLTSQESAGNTTVDVTPVVLTPGQPAKFEIAITTHSGNPVYDLKTQAELKDNKGQVYSFSS